MELTITRALSQVKNLDKRIDKKIEDFSVVTYAKNSSAVVMDGKYTREEFAVKTKAELQSIQDLIALRKEIKAKIVESNAKTKIMVGPKMYTVAEAIERKNSIELEHSLLSRLQKRDKVCTAFVNTKNSVVEENALGIIQSLASKDKAIKLEDNALAQNYVKENSYSLVDPINVNEVISKLDNEIDTFVTNVDYALSESNATTKITVLVAEDVL